MDGANLGLNVGTLATSNYGTSIQGITVCPDGNIYIGPSHCVVKIDAQLNQSLYAGNPSRQTYKQGNRLDEASFDTVGGLRIIDELLYICDRGAGVVARVEGDKVVTWAGSGVKGSQDGPRKSAQFSYPTDIISFQNKILISDYDNNLVRIVENGIVTSISCRGRPFAFASSEDSLFVSCHMGNAIREIIWENGTPRAPLIVGTVHEAGGYVNGKLESALFYRTRGLVVAGDQRDLFVADCLNHRIRKLSIEPPSTQDSSESSSFSAATDLSQHQIEPASIPYRYASDYCGVGDKGLEESGLQVRLQYPYFMAITPDGDLIWTEEYNKGIRVIRNFDPYSAIIRNPCIEMKTDRFLNFEALLKNDVLPHSKLLHKASQRTFTIHKQLLRMSLGEFTDEHLQRLETSSLSDFALEQFLSYTYGSLNFESQEDKKDLALSWANIVAILNRLQLDEKTEIFAFALLKLIRLLPDQKLTDLFKILVLIENEGKTSVDSVILLNLLHTISGQLGENRTSSESLKPLNEIKDVQRRNTLVTMVSTEIKPPIPTENFPFLAFQKQLEILAQALRLSNGPLETASESASQNVPYQKEQYYTTCKLHEASKAMISPNITIGVDKTDYVVHAHDWILYARWGYFRRAVDSGIWDVTSKRFDLPEDFPPSLLAPLLQYITSGGTFMTLLDSEYDFLFLQLRGGEFDLMDMDRISKPGFGRLLDCASRKLLRTPTYETCLPFYYFAVETGLTTRTQTLKEFITRNLDVILASPKLAADLIALPEHIAKGIQSL